MDTFMSYVAFSYCCMFYLCITVLSVILLGEIVWFSTCFITSKKYDKPWTSIFTFKYSFSERHNWPNPGLYRKLPITEITDRDGLTHPNIEDFWGSFVHAILWGALAITIAPATIVVVVFGCILLFLKKIYRFLTKRKRKNEDIF